MILDYYLFVPTLGNQWLKEIFWPTAKSALALYVVFVATFSKILPFADIKKDHKSPHNGAAGYIYISSGEQLRLMKRPAQAAAGQLTLFKWNKLIIAGHCEAELYVL